MNDARDVFKPYIRKNLIGPANDTFAGSAETEIISELPLRKYFSGIIFPNFDTSISTDDVDLAGDGDESGVDEFTGDTTQLEWPTERDEIVEELSKEASENDDFTRVELFPYSFGLSFCVSDSALSIKARLEYGHYQQMDPSLVLHPGYRISLSPEDYDLIKHVGLEKEQYLSDLLGYDPESRVVYLKRVLFGLAGAEATGDFKFFRDLRQLVSERRRAAMAEERDRYTRMETALRLLSPLFRKGWARVPVLHEVDIPISSLSSVQPFIHDHSSEANNPVCFRLYSVLVDNREGLMIVKIMVENRSVYASRFPVLLGRPALNERCMFQVRLEIESDHLVPFPRQPLPPSASIEDLITECQYRHTKLYAQSFNCACSWNQTPSGSIVVRSEFMPEVIPPVTTNSRHDMLEDTLGIFDNSCYSKISNSKVLKRLGKLADCYEAWVNEQKLLVASIEAKFTQAASLIIQQQEEALARMRDGIAKLTEDPAHLHIYRLAHAAMLVNMAKSCKRGLDFDPQDWQHLRYHPFQLAFLIINIPCMLDPGSRIRTQSIDLLWFPTGGGKTEAYLLLSAFTMLKRRLHHPQAGLGTSVIMRYTLRLLTAQQFERAARMILALDYVCSRLFPELIAGEPFTIGLWIGAASSPNKLREGDDSAAEINNRIIEAGNREAALQANKFPISECPWCGRSLVEFGRTGFNCLKTGFKVNCLDPACPFHANLPIDVVDESLYMHPPSLLFATVDKFARLAWVPESAAFFGGANLHPPELIIQDELHLISGPLGSITALFEGVVEMLCRKNGTLPRIIASTATIKNASSQAQALFGNRTVKTFPPPGIDQSDNFFAREDKSNLNREYIGIMPTGKSVTTTQVKLLALLLARRHKLRELKYPDIDNYWTLVSYYNSLRELGRMYGKARDEIQQIHLNAILKRQPFSKRYSLNRPRELTSRISGYEIKNVLHMLESVNVTQDSPGEAFYNAIDIVFATNMISVGLDIERLNLIVMNGQPKNVSEYIQVTSRIARKHPGLVFSLYNPFKVRDRSHYENFICFHHSFYRFVEPISVTPHTRVAIRKMVPTLMAAYLRLFKHIDHPAEVRERDLEDFMNFMSERIRDPEMSSFLERKLSLHMAYLRERLSRDLDLRFKDLLHSAADAIALDHDEGDWLTMNSMREISPNAVIKIVSSGKKSRGSDYE